MPHDPIAFSYWVVSSLPLDDGVKLTLLAVNSVVQRLRAELHIMRAVCCLIFHYHFPLISLAYFFRVTAA